MTSFIARSTTQRLVVWGIVVALILTVLATIPLTDEVQWNEAVAYIVLLLAGGGAYEMLQWLKTRDRTYRAAFGVGLGGALLLGWLNGAVGIIGSEDNPANLMYGAVFAVGFTGSLAARFRPRGMARTLFAAAAAQLLVPVTALVISPTVSWGDAGLLGVFVLNAVFATFFAGSALLFRRASHSIAVRRDVL